MSGHVKNSLPVLDVTLDPLVIIFPGGGYRLEFQSPGWDAYIGSVRRIAVAHPAQPFTIYRARRSSKDSTTYWNATVYVGRKALTVYVGKDTALTRDRLHTVGEALQARVANQQALLRVRRFPSRVLLTREQLRAIFGSLELDEIRAQLARLQALDAEGDRVACALLDLLAAITLPSGVDDGLECPPDVEDGDVDERMA